MSNAAKETILVAEDSIASRTILVHLLKKFDFEVLEADNGKAAWDILEKLPADKSISAVLSDIVMPVKDGIELLKTIRASERYQKIPFVLITAVSDKEYIMQAKSLSADGIILAADGYILKPVTFQRVLTKLEELFPEKIFPKIAV